MADGLSNRPAIPAETVRAIFVESGHRCAVCGTSFPLERAHIVPWSKSKEHNRENLICLCANCHEIADKDWDEKTFREYKNNPWVSRYSKPTTNGKQSTDVEITINMALADFDETKRRWLQYAIAGFLSLNPEVVTIVSASEGSVKVTISVPHSHAQRLLNAFDANDPELKMYLQDFDIAAIRRVTSQPSTPTPLPPRRPWQFPVIRQTLTVFGVLAGVLLYAALKTATKRVGSPDSFIDTTIFTVLFGLFGVGLSQLMIWYIVCRYAIKTYCNAAIESRMSDTDILLRNHSLFPLVQYSIPTIGFLGTIYEMSIAIIPARELTSTNSAEIMVTLTISLGYAFLTTLVAAVLYTTLSVAEVVVRWMIHRRAIASRVQDSTHS